MLNFTPVFIFLLYVGIAFLIPHARFLPSLFLILCKEHECMCRCGCKGQNHNFFEDFLAQWDQSVSGCLSLGPPTSRSWDQMRTWVQTICLANVGNRSRKWGQEREGEGQWGKHCQASHCYWWLDPNTSRKFWKMVQSTHLDCQVSQLGLFYSNYACSCWFSLVPGLAVWVPWYLKPAGCRNGSLPRL